MRLLNLKRLNGWWSNKSRKWRVSSRIKRRASETKSSFSLSLRLRMSVFESLPNSCAITKNNLHPMIVKSANCSMSTTYWTCSMRRSWSSLSRDSRRSTSSTRERSRRTENCSTPTGSSGSKWVTLRARRRTTRTRSLSWSKKWRGSGVLKLAGAGSVRRVLLLLLSITVKRMTTVSRLKIMTRERAETNRRKWSSETLGTSFKNIRKRGR